MRNFKKAVLIVVFGAAISCGFAFLWLPSRFVVPILTYHRFGYEKNTLFVTPENFERQMAYLKHNGYSVITFDALVEGIKHNNKFARHTVVITIDDGWQDNYTYAYPVLKKYGFPATIFIVSDLIDTNKGFLTWDEIKTMSGDGILFGCHTRNHAYLPSLKDKTRLWDEIAGCKKTLEEKLGMPADYFCYPTGGFTEEIKSLVKKAGYKGACTTARGYVGMNKDVYELKRIKITNSDTDKPFSFRAKISGYYLVFKRAKGGN